MSRWGVCPSCLNPPLRGTNPAGVMGLNPGPLRGLGSNKQGGAWHGLPWISQRLGGVWDVPSSFSAVLLVEQGLGTNPGHCPASLSAPKSCGAAASGKAGFIEGKKIPINFPGVPGLVLSCSALPKWDTSLTWEVLGAALTLLSTDGQGKKIQQRVHELS